MVAQVAVALTLLVAAGLMVRSFQNVRAIDPGFAPASALFRIAIESASYADRVFFRAIAGGYFETIGMAIVRGRALLRDDVERREPHVVINQAMAQTYFPIRIRSAGALRRLGRRVIPHRCG